jgi:hypothetical protein
MAHPPPRRPARPRWPHAARWSTSPCTRSLATKTDVHEPAGRPPAHCVCGAMITGRRFAFITPHLVCGVAGPRPGSPGPRCPGCVCIKAHRWKGGVPFCSAGSCGRHPSRLDPHQTGSPSPRAPLILSAAKDPARSAVRHRDVPPGMPLPKSSRADEPAHQASRVKGSLGRGEAEQRSEPFASRPAGSAEGSPSMRGIDMAPPAGVPPMSARPAPANRNEKGAGMEPAPSASRTSPPATAPSSA